MKMHYGYEIYRPGLAATSGGARYDSFTMCGRDFGSVSTTNIMHEVTCLSCMRGTRPDRLSAEQRRTVIASFARIHYSGVPLMWRQLTGYW